MSDDICEGTWQEVMYKRMKVVKNSSKVISKALKKAIEQIEDECNVDGIMDDLDAWYMAFKKKIHIPVWNKLSECTPDELDVPAHGYVVSYKDQQDMAFQATWREKEKMFYTWSSCDNEWYPDPTAHFWIPLTYPEIW